MFSVNTINEYASLVVAPDFLTVDDPYGGLNCDDSSLLSYLGRNDNETWATGDYATC